MNNLILADLYDLAKRAHYGTSFDPEKRGRQVIESHSQQLSDDLENMPKSERKRYEENYRKHLMNYLHAHSRCVSSMIAGPSNFPVARMLKYSDWADNKLKAFIDWREKSLKSIAKKIEGAKSPEQKLNEQWQDIKVRIDRFIKTIIAIDEGIERGYDRALFVTNLAKRLETLAKNGQTELVNKSLDLISQANKGRKKPVVSSRHSIWKLRKIAEAKREKIVDNTNRENQEIEINGVKVVQNWRADRLQLFFPSIPDESLRTELKKSGWKWSRFNGCWQRKNTNNAIQSAKRILYV